MAKRVISLKLAAHLCVEALFYPFLMAIHWLRVLNPPKIDSRQRKEVIGRFIQVVVHEWGGYPPLRCKRLKNGRVFECGLAPQIERFVHHKRVELRITISQGELSDELLALKQKYQVVEIANRGFDFAGYNNLYQRVKDAPNSYIILTNSSVNSHQEEFLQSYIDYMEQNLDVGMLGISYSTQMQQTLVRPNFMPHLQSFFLMTTTNVLREIVERNGGKFPGAAERDKLMIIRRGEVTLSRLCIALGYRLAVVNQEDRSVYKFENFKDWELPKGDIRLKYQEPNRVIKIEKWV